MCGIAGFVLSKIDDLNNGVLKAMANALAHRGPDDEGYYTWAPQDRAYRIGLAHRRLSIIDLDSGHQPIGNEDDTIQIVFNGEIYNYKELRDALISRGHRFKTNSDTETIVHAYEEYGYDCLSHFRGMFAFAIWDSNKQTLFLARDRYGKKPLYLHRSGNDLLFSSEIKSILASGTYRSGVDTQAIWHYLSYRYVPGPLTLFEEISKLPPGHCATWRDGHFSQWSWFTPSDCLPQSQVYTGNDPVGDFLEELDESVRIRLVSDVPFGAFLSGGIDSSAVVGLMSKHCSSPVKTFSVGFAESEYSELAYAKTIAEQFKTDHHELTVSQAHLMDHLPTLIRYRDAPVAEPSDIPIYLLSREARKHVKMVLTGEGSDEILGGYPKHVYERLVDYYQLIPATIRKSLVEPAIRRLPYRYRRAKTAINNLGLAAWDDRMPRWFGALSWREREEFISFSCNAPPSLHMSPCKDSSALRRILCFDQTSWLPDNLLERGDRMTMAASIEARMPFMDHELAAFVSSMPDRYRVRGKSTKWLLREAMKQILPTEILERPKVGFRVPVNEWFRGQMKDYLLDHLTGPSSRTAAYYKNDALHRVLDEHIRGRQNHEKLLWMLLNLELWHREYGISA